MSGWKSRSGCEQKVSGGDLRISKSGPRWMQIGRGSWRGKGWNSGGAGSFKKKKNCFVALDLISRNTFVATVVLVYYSVEFATAEVSQAVVVDQCYLKFMSCTQPVYLIDFSIY